MSTSKQRGKFVVLEGGEGCGKSSLIAYLRDALKDQNFYFTREPGGTPFAEDLRGLITGEGKEYEEKIDPVTELLIFFAARRQHLISINKLLSDGINVICDRFSLSTLAYQIYGRKRKYLVTLFNQLNNKIVGSASPDITILLDIDYKIGLERSKKVETNRFEEESPEFHARVNQAFRDNLGLDFCGKGLTIDAGINSEAHVRNFVAQFLSTELGILVPVA